MRVEGGAQLARALQQLPARTSRRVQLEALKAAAAPMAASAADLAPRAPGEPDLADNIAVMAARGASTGGLPAVAYGPTRSFFYGFFQEFGTRHHGAQPFMRPSFDRGVAGALGTLRSTLWRALIGRGIGSARGRGSQGTSESFGQARAPRVGGGPGGGLL
jgi:HK97 gp10 family phage protein